LVVSAADGSLVVLLESKETAAGNHAELEIVTASQGRQGPQGLAGPQGPSGFPGRDGVAGAAGASGPQGIAGALGPQGPAGERGPAGEKGPAGERGPAGTSSAGIQRVKPIGDIAMGIFTQGEKP